MTAIQLCKAIKKLVTTMSGEATSHTLVVYAKTWSIVCLYVDGLIRPYPTCIARLTDLYNVLNGIREDRVIVTPEAADVLVKAQLGDDYGVSENANCLWLARRNADGGGSVVGSICPSGSPLAAFKQGFKEVRQTNKLV